MCKYEFDLSSIDRQLAYAKSPAQSGGDDLLEEVVSQMPGKKGSKAALIILSKGRTEKEEEELKFWLCYRTSALNSHFILSFSVAKVSLLTNTLSKHTQTEWR